ncbi:MAG: hypothetical protein HY508_11425 [Acidobacteria bacterium]|nr:hypothetical protein [Acidobacteriota bacterium]
MGLLGLFRKSERKFWFVCYNCMMLTNHDEVKSIFYYSGPPTLVVGRPLTPCPRCQNTNTVSFQQLKDDGSEAQLWGLERTVKKYPRSTFEVNPQSVKTTG